jgi:hypothetical protein
MDGGQEDTGPRVIDCVVREGGVAAAAEHLVHQSPFGWGWAGGERLMEVDDYLAGAGLSETTPQEVFDRHYAIYLLDPTRHALDVKVLPDNAWLEPVTFTSNGAVTALPAWYPQPHANDRIETRAVPPEVQQKIQQFCTTNRIRPTVLMTALREWCVALFGDLTAVTWLYCGDGNEDAGYVARRIDGVSVRIALGRFGTAFTSSDGRLRCFGVNDVALAGKMFDALKRLPRYAGPQAGVGLPSASHAMPIIEILLSAAYVTASGTAGSTVSWFIDKWKFRCPSSSGYLVEDHNPTGWLALFLSWLL